MPDRNDDELLTAQQVAAYLGIKETAFGDARRAGEVPEPIRIGSSVRWRWGDLREWARSMQLIRQVTPKVFKKSGVVKPRIASPDLDSHRNSPDEDLPPSGAKKGK